MRNRREFMQAAAGALAVGTTMTWPKSSPAEDTAPAFAAATTISGSARERGRQYGALCGEEIRGFLEREILATFVDQPASRDDLLHYAEACWEVICDECPVIAEEMRGMAEETGLSLAEHVLLTLHEELYHRSGLPPVPHCTAVAVGRPLTRDGGTFVGQTWDWMPSVAGLSRVLSWQRDDGPSLLAYAFPGLWVGAGLNAQGLALCWTSAGFDRGGQTPRAGLPSYVQLAHLLYQENLDDVRAAALRDRHAGWFTFVMADGSGRLLNVEGSPDGVEIEEASGELVRVGYGTRRMCQTPATEAVPRHARCHTVQELLAAAVGQVDAATLQEAFADPARGVCVGRNTIDLMVYDTARRTARLSRGAHYGVAWQEYGFA